MTAQILGRYVCPNCGKKAAVLPAVGGVRFWCHDAKVADENGNMLCPATHHGVVHRLEDLRSVGPASAASATSTPHKPEPLHATSSVPTEFAWPKSPEFDLDDTDRGLLADLVEYLELTDGRSCWFSRSAIAWTDLVAHKLVTVRDEVEHRPGLLFEVLPSKRARDYLRKHRAKKRAKANGSTARRREPRRRRSPPVGCCEANGM